MDQPGFEIWFEMKGAGGWIAGQDNRVLTGDPHLSPAGGRWRRRTIRPRRHHRRRRSLLSCMSRLDSLRSSDIRCVHRLFFLLRPHPPIDRIRRLFPLFVVVKVDIVLFDMNDRLPQKRVGFPDYGRSDFVGTVGACYRFGESDHRFELSDCYSEICSGATFVLSQ